MAEQEVTPDLSGDAEYEMYRLQTDDPSQKAMNLYCVLRFLAHATSQTILGTVPRFDDDDACGLQVLLNECAHAASSLEGEISKMQSETEDDNG